MKIVKLIFRRIKRFADKFLGMKTDKLYWKFRHIFDRSWANDYISEKSLNLSYRRLLINKISEHFPFETVLEIGCASGPNLYLLAKKIPQAKFYGIDISKKAIETGKKFFAKENIKNVFLEHKGLENLKNFKDKSIDIIFSAAVLIYLASDEIELAIKEILRVAKKSIILIELHTDSPEFIYTNHCIYNYELLFKKHISKEKIKITKYPEKLRDVDFFKYGCVIEIVK